MERALVELGRPVGVKELLRLMGMNPGQLTHLKRVLRELVRGGTLESSGKRFFLRVEKSEGPKAAQERGRGRSHSHPPEREAPSKPNHNKPNKQSGPRIEGTVSLHADGFGFVRVAGAGPDVEDVFLPPHEAQKLLDGDKVSLEIVPGRGGRTMGRVLDLVDRTRQMAVGVYRESGHEGLVECEGLGLVRVPKTQLARPGDAVKVRLGAAARLLGPGEALVGEVAGSIGRPGDRSVEVLAIAYKKGFHDEFPPAVMDEADRFELQVRPEEAIEPGRRDLRSVKLVTIDGEDARDFDDAVFCEETPTGWRLVVAIADVAQYVKPGTALDDEARRRATSVYLPGRVLPMLPERLSNGLCSLVPHQDRLCLVADLQIGRDGAPQSTRLYPGLMRSAARCTYNEVHDVLEGTEVPGRTELKPMFERLLALSHALHGMRSRRGAIDFDLPETRVELGEDGQPLRMVRRERWESHRIVEECMLAANEAVARWFNEQELPTVHRHHGEPDEEKLELFRALALAYGLQVPAGDLSSKQLNALLAQLAGHPEQRALNQLLLRSMMQAVYSAERGGHYGLAAPDYLHFTSPIRRYPDLLVHRLLKDHWKHGRAQAHRLEALAAELEGMAQSSSERERAAMQVEREVVSFYSALMLEGRVGEEMAGVIAGLSDKAAYVELEGLFIEGQLPADTLAQRWHFVPERHRLVLGGGKELKVGMPVRVRLAVVSPARRLILLAPVELDGKPVADRRAHEAAATAGEPARPEKFLARLEAHRQAGGRKDERHGGGKGRAGKPPRGEKGQGQGRAHGKQERHEAHGKAQGHQAHGKAQKHEPHGKAEKVGAAAAPEERRTKQRRGKHERREKHERRAKQDRRGGGRGKRR